MNVAYNRTVMSGMLLLSLLAGCETAPQEPTLQQAYAALESK